MTISRRMMTMREKLERFMAGRYGMDYFGRFTMILGLVVLLIAGWTGKPFLTLTAWILIIYTYCRMFSKNVYKRATENQKYLNSTYKIRTFWARQKNMMAQRKTHHIYKCPTCRQKIRIPRGKGKIEIRCPKCNATFIKKS